VLWPADPAGAVRAHVEQTDVAHPLEVGPNRVRVKAQRLGDVGRGQRPRRAGTFA
jgi:hypothetical protein